MLSELRVLLRGLCLEIQCFQVGPVGQGLANVEVDIVFKQRRLWLLGEHVVWITVVAHRGRQLRARLLHVAVGLDDRHLSFRDQHLRKLDIERGSKLALRQGRQLAKRCSAVGKNGLSGFANALCGLGRKVSLVDVAQYLLPYVFGALARQLALSAA